MKRALPVLLLLAYPVLVHASVVLERPLLAFLALVSLTAFALFAPLSNRRPWAWLALAGAAAALYLLSHSAGGIYALYLPSLVIPLLLGAMFGATLLPGREPLITGIARAERGGTLAADLALYTRRLTQLWTLVFGLMFASALALILLGEKALWSLTTNFLNYVLVGAMFAVEYAWRRWRYRHHPHPSFIEHIRVVARARRSPAPQ